jgi:hypothetical protein
MLEPIWLQICWHIGPELPDIDCHAARTLALKSTPLSWLDVQGGFCAALACPANRKHTRVKIIPKRIFMGRSPFLAFTKNRSIHDTQQNLLSLGRRKPEPELPEVFKNLKGR